MSNKILLKNGYLIDGTGSSGKANSSLLISNGKIQAVGNVPAEMITIDTEIVDCVGTVIMPGLIDAHLHLFGRREMSHTIQICEDPILRGMRCVMDAWRLIDAGFTTVRDATSGNGIHLRNCINEGAIIGPRVIASGLALSQTGGHGELMHSIPIEFANRGLSCRVADGVSEVRKAAREQIRAGADYLKIYTTGGVMSENGSSQECQYTVEEIAACTQEAKNRGLFTAAHAQGTRGIRNAILGGVDIIDHGVYMDQECLDLMLEHGCSLIPTISIFPIIRDKGLSCGIPDYKVEKAKSLIEIQRKSFKMCYDAGVLCGLGSDFLSDAAMTPLGDNIIEFVNYVEIMNLSLIETVKCATHNNAKILGIGDVTGDLSVGKDADILIVKDAILKDVKTISDRKNINKIYRKGAEVPRMDNIPMLRRK